MVKHRIKRSVGYLNPSVGEAAIADLQRILDALSSEESVLPFGKVTYLSSEWLSKFVGHNTDPAELRDRRAVEKWRSMERRNAKTNLRLFYGCEADFGFATSEEIIEFASRSIRKLIGDRPPEGAILGTFSNGASVTIRRQPGALAHKFTDQASVTSEAFDFLQTIVGESELWTLLGYPDGFMPKVVEGNVLFTVPKTATINRCACKEPDLNMYIQRGIGLYLRRCLRAVGIDLTDQTKNQRLAFLGSLPKGHPLGQSLATLDLSSASDTLSESLVQRLLPLEWFWTLDRVRSKRTLVGDEWVPLNMFSSMGNGFTFELETLVFYSIVRAVAYFTGSRGTISVYGDDIIVPSRVAPLLPRVFHYFGFLVNPKKSHWKGLFRESCGKHYHGGKDVTPFYIREPIIDQTKLIHLLNQLRRWSLMGPSIGCDPSFFEYWSKYSKYIDKKFRGSWDVNRIDVLVGPGVAGRVLKRKTRDLETKVPHGAYLSWLHQRLESPNAQEPLTTSETLVELDEFVTRPYRYYGEDLVHRFWGLE